MQATQLSYQKDLFDRSVLEGAWSMGAPQA